MPQPSTSTQIPLLSPTLLAAENYYLRKEIDDLKLFKHQFSYEDVKAKNLVNFYTGLPNSDIFEALFELTEKIEFSYYNKSVEKICKKDQLLLTIMKLRHNFPHIHLACMFSISTGTVTNIFITYLHILKEILFDNFMKEIPSRRKNKSCLPNSFSTFTNCRMIMDCTEIPTVVPRKSMANQKRTYSSYKHRTTFKGLVVVAPNGVITYLSSLYPGATSDRQIVVHSKILEKLESGDLVLADKGFLIRDLMPEGTYLNIPPFLNTPQFTPEQIKETERIAKARIHVERAIRRMKCFKILDKIPQSLIKNASTIFKVVGALTNLQNPLIKEVEDLFDE